MELEIRKHLHDISNALTVVVGRAELLSKSKNLTDEDRKDMREIVEQGFVCFNLIEKARNVFNSERREGR